MTKATIKTNKGDMKFNLYDDLAPKTVENFVTHAKTDIMTVLFSTVLLRIL